MRWIALALVTVGCVPAPEFRGVDARSDDALDPADAAIDATPLPPWGEPVLVAELQSKGSDECAWLSDDRKELFLVSLQPPNSKHQIYTAKRTSTTSLWSAPSPISELADPTRDMIKAVVSRSGLEMFVAAAAAQSMDYDIYWTDRLSPTAPWNALTLVDELSTVTTWQIPGAFVAEDTTMYLTQQTGTGDFQIHTATRPAGSDQFTLTALPVPNINSPEVDEHPWVNADETLMFFSSERDGDRNIYTTSRASRTQVWATPTLVENINIPGLDYCPFLVDDHTLYFTSFRGGQTHIYVSTR